MWFKKQEASPKEERELSPVQDALNELNTLQAAVNQRIRNGAKVHNASVLILQDRAYEVQRELLHEMDVVPVVDQKSGLWKLFGR